MEGVENKCSWRDFSACGARRGGTKSLALSILSSNHLCTVGQPLTIVYTNLTPGFKSQFE